MDDSGSPRKNQHFSKRVKAFFGGKDKTLADVTEEEIRNFPVISIVKGEKWLSESVI